MPHITTPPEVRFWAKVNKHAPPPATAPGLGGCWLWGAGKTSRGYGVFHPTKQRIAMAHRWAMEQHLGRSLAREEFVCHRCDTPACVNPSHLFIGTHLDNMADMRAKGRACWGEARSRLTLDEVVEMRHEAARGALLQDLARKFGTVESNVSGIIRGQYWVNAPGPITKRYKKEK